MDRFSDIMKGQISMTATISAATLTIMPNGINAGYGGGNGSPPNRGNTKGWSAGSARRNKKFLQSVFTPDLDGSGLALTLTVRDCPETHDEWERIRQSFVKFLKRRELLRLHWITEWQERGAPHFHMSAYFPDEYVERNPRLIIEIMQHWCKLTKHLGTLSRGQHYAEIDGGTGWQQYVSKHASRGYGHYQREQGSIPKGWQKTGRLWGKSGEWPTISEKIAIDQKSFQRLRRMSRSYLVSEARTALQRQKSYGDPEKIKAATRKLSFARSMLKINDRTKSEVRGINEWVPFEITSRMVDLLAKSETAFIRSI